MSHTSQIADGDRTETDAAFDAGIAASEPAKLDETNRFYSVTAPAGATHKVIDLEELAEKSAYSPRRKTGTYKVHTALSFVDFVKKHGPDAEVWADEARQSLVAVLNASTGDSPEWEDHRVQMELVKTPGWLAWAGQNGNLLDQETFAELIEARTIDIVDPSAADMLEIAETFHATTGVQFKSSKILNTGERTLSYVENINASAGAGGELTIPKQFILRVAPFVGSAPQEIIARFRYRIGNGQLRLGYVLERPEDVLQAAFTELITSVQVDLPDDVPVYYGSPK